MNQKSFCEASNLINKREDKRVTIYLKSGERFNAEMNRKEIYDNFEKRVKDFDVFIINYAN